MLGTQKVTGSGPELSSVTAKNRRPLCPICTETMKSKLCSAILMLKNMSLKCRKPSFHSQNWAEAGRFDSLSTLMIAPDGN